MGRHRWFIQQMFRQLNGMNGSMVEHLMNQVEPYMETDMDGDTIKQLASYQVSDTMMNIPGETHHGQAHDEFYIDQAALQTFLLELFYVPAE